VESRNLLFPRPGI